MQELNAPPSNALALKLAGYFSLPGLLFFGTIFSIPLLFFGLPLPIVPTLIATLVAEIALIVTALAVTSELKNWKEMLGLHKPSVKGISIGVAFGIFAFVMLQVINALLTNLFSLEGGNSETSDMIAATEGAQRILVLLILAPFVVPFVEELVFRGYTLTFLLKGHAVENAKLTHSKVLLAIFVSSLYFALVHVQGFSSYTDVLIPVWVFLVACGNAVLRIKFNSLYVAFASHAAYNLATSLIILTS